MTFQEAIALSSQWISLWDTEELSDDVLADYVGDLVRERDGARGFFVAALTGESPLMDRLPESLVLKLRAAGMDIVDLTTRNLAMSTAMSVQHARDQHQDLLEGSLKVQSRSRELLKMLDPNLVKQRIEAMLLGLASKGEDKAFFDRWEYDLDQRKEIESTLLSVAD